jgi:hypothetical protein
VVTGVHHTSTNLWAATLPAFSAGLAKASVPDLRIPDFPERGVTLTPDKANFGGRQFQGYIVPFLGHHLGTGACGSHHLATPSCIQLNVVHAGAEGNGRQRQSIPCFDGCVWTRNHPLTDAQSGGMQDVPLFPIAVVEKR